VGHPAKNQSRARPETRQHHNPDLDGEKGAVGDDFQLVVARAKALHDRARAADAHPAWRLGGMQAAKLQARSDPEHQNTVKIFVSDEFV
jgi:hypothetical protein